MNGLVPLKLNPASKVVQIRAALVPVPSPDKGEGCDKKGIWHKTQPNIFECAL